jgi:nucleoside-diphosphate-sugar epimerase
MRIGLNPSLAREQLGWQAQMPLFEGLAKTYQFFRDNGA